MFQVLNPIWLVGISGIIVPLLIHLWNVKKGKTLKIGSVSLLAESSKQNARSLRLLDLLLLLLRCLLIIIISIVLAEPVWVNTNTTEQSGGWILMEKNNLKETYPHFKKEIDSLVQKGYDLHLLEPGFKTTDLNNLNNNEIINDSIANQLSYWSLLSMLDQEIPIGKDAYIFTPNRLNRLKGERTEIIRKLNWKTYTPKDSTATWLESAWFRNDSIKAIIAEAGPQGIKKISVNIDPSDRNSAFSVDIKDGLSSLSYKNISGVQQNPVPIDTSTIRVAVYTDIFKKDAEYLIAAIRAIQNYTERKIEVSLVYSGLISGNQNIIFWLSENKPPNDQIKNLKEGSTLFLYHKGKTKEVNSLIVLAEQSLQKEEIELRKRIIFKKSSKKNYAVWEDGFGEPLLDLESVNRLNFYHFYSRFNPEWNGLVWNEDFAKILTPIIIPKVFNQEFESFDRRAFSENIITANKTQRQSDILQTAAKSDLKNIFWTFLILVFLCERWLSFKKYSN